MIAYVLDGLLIDTGPPVVGPQLRRLLADLDLLQVVNTHAHEDHVGNNELLRGPCPSSGGKIKISPDLRRDPRMMEEDRQAAGFYDAAHYGRLHRVPNLSAGMPLPGRLSGACPCARLTASLSMPISRYRRPG